MRNIIIATSIVSGLVVLLVLILLATQVGGIAIRSTGSRSELVPLLVADPALRGVPLTVRWEESNQAAAGTVELYWRDSGEQILVGTSVREAQQARVILPCTSTDTKGSLVLVDQATAVTIGTQPLTLLPPGADCVWQ